MLVQNPLKGNSSGNGGPNMGKSGEQNAILKNPQRKANNVMAKPKKTDRDGIYKRKDRPGYWITWTDAQGHRRRRSTDAQTLAQAVNARAAELLRVEQTRTLGLAPPGEETFREVAARFL